MKRMVRLIGWGDFETCGAAAGGRPLAATSSPSMQIAITRPMRITG